MNKRTQEKFEQWFERYSKEARLKDDHIKMAIKGWAWSAWRDASLGFESALHDLKLLKESNDFYSDGYLFSEDLSDDDCEEVTGKPWLFHSGLRARQINKKLKFDYSELEE